jgi:hypothetical protein
MVISHEIVNPVHVFDQSNTQTVERARVRGTFQSIYCCVLIHFEIYNELCHKLP